MKDMLWVGLGGFIGAIGRFQLSSLIGRHFLGMKFPLGTVVVNITGCLIAGLLAGLAAKNLSFDPGLRLFLFVGVLGGFTTFSAFGIETLALVEANEVRLALLNVVLSVSLGLAAVWVGLKVS